MKFCFEIYYFDEDEYGFPVKFEGTSEFIAMDSRSSLNDVSLFIGSLLSFNEMVLGEEFVSSLSKEEEMALVGGLLFEKNGKSIGPSCCADIQDWKNVASGIKNRKSSWLGHDPSSWFEFKGENITLWSDEPGKENIKSITFSQSEFDTELETAVLEDKGFIEVVNKWASINYMENPKSLIQGICGFLSINASNNGN